MLDSIGTMEPERISLFVPYAKTQEETERAGQIRGSEEVSGASFERLAVIHSSPPFLERGWGRGFG
jgi:hypothetical protein